MKVCTVEDCPKKPKSRGLCAMHLNRWYRHGDVHTVATLTAQPPAPCGVEDCGRDLYARGWCASHYQRWVNHGDVFADVPIDEHGRALREARGLIETEPEPEQCVDCGGEPDGGMIRCWPCASQDLSRRTARKPFGQSTARPSEDRTCVRRATMPTFAGRQGAA